MNEFDEGYDAFYEGEEHENNPYPEDSIEWEDWDDGFELAMDDEWDNDNFGVLDLHDEGDTYGYDRRD
jgi:hypothetical protein